VSAISAAISAGAATITFAWPHLEPIVRIWLQNHAGFMTRAENLLQEVIDTGDDLADNVSIQQRIDGLVEEAAELHRAVYKENPLEAVIKKARAKKQERVQEKSATAAV
jgi:hypothetical protein